MKKIFLFIACSYFLFFFLIPPFQAPDEPEHYETAFWVSQFKWPYIPKKKQAPNVKYYMADITKTYDSGMVPQPFVLPNFEKIENSPLHKKLGYTEKEIKQFSQMSSNAYHPPVVFILSSVFLHVADFFKLDIITRFYMARLASMFLYFGTVITVYKIFKLLFKDKKIISSLLIFFSINPLLLSNSSGINPDNAVIFFSTLIFYLFLRIAHKRIHYSTCISFGIVCGIATMSKFSGLTTLGFIGLILLIKYQFSIEFIKKASILLITWLITTLPWFGLNYVRYHKPIVDNFTILPLKPLDPMPPLKAALSSLFEFRHTFMHFSGFIGWNETHPFKLFFIAYAIILFTLTFLGFIKIFREDKPSNRYLLLYFSLYLVFLFFLGFNFKLIGVSWDIQGRYLLPVFFTIPIMVCYGLSLFTKKSLSWLSKSMMIWSIFHYYYVLFFVLLPKYYV